MIKRIKQFSLTTNLIILIMICFCVFSSYRLVINSIKEKRIDLVALKDNYETSFTRKINTNKLLYYTTGLLNSDQVVLGEDDWMFLFNKSENSLDDYRGTNRYSKKQLETIKNNVLAVQNKLKKENIEFCMFVAPNKENIYSEYVPKILYHSDNNRTDCLVECLVNSEVNVVNAKDILLDKKNDHYRLYYRQDTHWNELGAYTVTRNAIKTFDVDLPDYTLSDVKIANNPKSDCADMIGLKNVFSEDSGFTTDNTYNNIDWKKFESEQESGFSHFHNSKAKEKKRILLVGDSFRAAMIPTLCYAFKDVYILQKRVFNESTVEKIKPNFVLYETVERYSDGLLNLRLN